MPCHAAVVDETSTTDPEKDMASRKPKHPELAAAAGQLAEAAQHVRQAVSQKVEHIEATVSADIDKAKKSAVRNAPVRKTAVKAMASPRESI